MDPQIDPPVPYLGQIQGGFSPGKMVRIQGFVSPVGERFDINFQTSANTTPRDDIGLHLSVRLLEGYVARNSIQSGVWGEEQNQGDLPIQPGEKYEIIVLSDSTEYKIAINGKHFGEFPQRIPPSNISHLSIEGDTSLSLISFETFNVSSQKTQAPRPQESQSFGPPAGTPVGYGSPGGGFGELPSTGYGPPPQGYGPPPGYGPPGQFGPPGYGPPPPPGGEDKESGLESFLDSAGPLLAGAISSGMAEKLLSSITGGGANNQQQQPQQQYQQQQPQQHGGDALGGLGSLLSSFTQPQQQSNTFSPSNVGGQGSVGNLGSVGSLLTNFAGQLLQPQNKGGHQ